jgi:glycosyltransferase involved in cell wall biosynthesis
MAALITTILPTYRRPQLLRRAIRSVLAQTCGEFVVYVCDNASGDETAEVVAEFASYDSRVQYHCHRENIGAVANFNYGIAQVATPYFSMLSDDDLLMPEFYARAMEGLETYPSAFAFCSTTVWYDPERRSVRRSKALQLPELFPGPCQVAPEWSPGYYEPSTSSIKRMIVNHFGNTGVVFKTRVRDTIGVLNQFGSDWVYMTQLADAHPFVVSEYTGAAWSVHEHSFSAGLARTPSDALAFALSLLLALLNLKGLDLSDRICLFHAFHEVAGHTVAAHCMSKLAAGDLAGARTAADQLRNVRLSFKDRLGVACADLVSHANSVGPAILSGLVALRRCFALAPGISQPSEADRKILDYIVKLETEVHAVALRAKDFSSLASRGTADKTFSPPTPQ